MDDADEGFGDVERVMVPEGECRELLALFDRTHPSGTDIQPHSSKHQSAEDDADILRLSTTEVIQSHAESDAIAN